MERNENIVIMSVVIFITKDLHVQLIPIKAYDAEDTIIKKIEKFSFNKKSLYKTLTDIRSSSAHSISQLNKELEKIEIRLKEMEQLQAKYNDKRMLEQKKNEVIIQLGSIDSKVIQPELIEKLLKIFLSVYKQTSMGKSKTITSANN